MGGFSEPVSLVQFDDTVCDDDLSVFIADDETGSAIRLPALRCELRAVEDRACESNTQSLEASGIAGGERIDD